MRKIFLSFIIFIGLASPSQSEGDEWFVRKDDFKCFLKYIEKYRDQRSNRVLVFLDKCPRTDVLELLLESTESSSDIRIKGKENTRENPADVISYTKGELDCVAKLSINENDEILAIPKKPC